MKKAIPNRLAKKLFVAFVVIAFTIFLILYTVQATKNAPQVSRVGLPTATDVHILETTSEETDPNNTWTVKLAYPQVAGVFDSVLEKEINTRIQTLVDSTVTEFKKEANEQSKETTGSDPANQLFISYLANRVDSSFISLDFTISQYYYHMAHPDTVHTTITYSLVLKKELQIADMFADKANFAQVLSDLAIAELNTQLGPDPGITSLVASGASPSAKNFTKFNIGESDLILIFDPSQVAPYSAGVRHVNIPFETLTPIINPDLNLI